MVLRLEKMVWLLQNSMNGGANHRTVSTFQKRQNVPVRTYADFTPVVSMDHSTPMDVDKLAAVHTSKSLTVSSKNKAKRT